MSLFAFDRKRAGNAADWLAVAMAASLPISTSATLILAAIWALTLLPTLTGAEWRARLATPACAFPVILVALAIAGMAWADVSWIERWRGLDSVLKLLAIPVLIIQFSRSARGHWVLWAYLAACFVVLVLSTVISLFPGLNWRSGNAFPAPFKNPATQSGEFVTCIAVLLYVAVERWRAGRKDWAVASLLLCAAFLCSIVFSATARTPLVVAPILVVLLAVRSFNVRGAIAILLGAAVVGGALFSASSHLRSRTVAIWEEIHAYETQSDLTSSGERLEFWKKSLRAIARAPIIGHGTGSIPEQMALETSGQTGPYATVTPNPHQQTLAVAIQLGAAGVVVLWAMWIAHLLLFRGSGGLAGWIGLVVVVQNVIGSLFNSHLFDFMQGWVYVVGVGVAGGMMLRARALRADSRADGCVVTAPPLYLPKGARILVVALRRLGDVLLTTPLIRSMRRAWPNAVIDVLVFADTAGILQGNPDVDNVIVMPPRPSARESLALARSLWRRYALAVSTQAGDRPTFFAAVAGKIRVALVEEGAKGDWKRRVLDRHVAHAAGVHRVEEILRFADALGIPRAPEVVCPQASAASEFLVGGGYAVIHAAPFYRYKEWTREGWRDVAAALTQRGLTVIATGGAAAAERRYLDEIWGAGAARVRRLDGRLNWPQLAGLLAKAKVYVGPDTSVTHLAAASGCPTVALYGPTDPRLWAPWPAEGLHEPWAASGDIQRRGNVWLVQNALPCTPCQLEGCERRLDSYSACLDELSPLEVIAVVDEALASANAAPTS